MLVRYDPFRDFDRKAPRRQWMPMDAFRQDQQVELRFDLPGIDLDALEVEVERNVLTVRAERSWRPGEGVEVLAQERAQGSVVRQVMLGDALDADRLDATYDAGVLTITIPVAEQAKPRKVEIHAGSAQPLEVGATN